MAQLSEREVLRVLDALNICDRDERAFFLKGRYENERQLCRSVGNVRNPNIVRIAESNRGASARASVVGFNAETILSELHASGLPPAEQARILQGKPRNARELREQIQHGRDFLAEVKIDKINQFYGLRSSGFDYSRDDSLDAVDRRYGVYHRR